MGRKISFPVKGAILGKEYLKAMSSWKDNSGREVAAKPEHFDVYVVFGDISSKTDLFICKPALAIASVTKESFLAIKSQTPCNCIVRQKNDYYEVLEIDGFDVVGIKTEEDDFDEDFDISDDKLKDVF